MGSYSIQGPYDFDTMNGLSDDFTQAMADTLGIAPNMVNFQVNDLGGGNVELKWEVQGEMDVMNAMQSPSFSSDFQSTLNSNPAISSAMGSSNISSIFFFLYNLTNV